MSFENTSRIIALLPDLIPTLFPSLLEQYGEVLQDGDREIPTIGAYWDDISSTRKRAASLHDGTIQPIPLIDGRVAFIALWQLNLAQLFDIDGIEGTEQLTPEQLEELKVQSEL